MDDFTLIVGLGNPGEKYHGTRHNVGFAVIDRLVTDYNADGPRRFGRSLTGRARIGDAKVILMKPMTYMNLSGEAVREGVDFYKIDHTARLIVISDDINLPAGRLRIRVKGSAGGHNGLKSIISHLGDDTFIRVRVGVGAKPSQDADLADYVLGRPAGEDRELLEEAVIRAAKAVACIVEEGAQSAMNQYNG